MENEEEMYYFSSYYKYGFHYTDRYNTKRMSLPYDLQNSDDIYRMSLGYEMTEAELLAEGFVVVEE